MQLSSTGTDYSEQLGISLGTLCNIDNTDSFIKKNKHAIGCIYQVFVHVFSPCSILSRFLLIPINRFSFSFRASVEEFGLGS